MGIRIKTLIKWKEQDEKAYKKTIMTILQIGIVFGLTWGIMIGWYLAKI